VAFDFADPSASQYLQLSVSRVITDMHRSEEVNRKREEKEIGRREYARRKVGLGRHV